ncbi:MAG: HAMP domain-containing histidine kinase [Deltaproteobacteria bacterium]|nr:HAMP domain-containing histidine kinase [Deltaproteobacteria bacterium]
MTSELRTTHLINFSWLIKLRWVAVTGQVLTTLGAERFLDLHLPLAPMFFVIGLTLLTNVAFALWASRGTGIGEWTVASVMALDVSLLTALLYLTGGPANPFSCLYFVHIALSAVALRATWTWSLVGLSLVAFGFLFVTPIPDASAAIADRLTRTLGSIWLASALAAAVLAYFVTRVQNALALREQELAAARAQQARNDKLASLATLSAGAAHELSTPLSTIAVVAKELERAMQKHGEAEMIEDARLIREQVARCRTILEQMAADAGQSLGELSTKVSVRTLLDLCLELLHSRERVRIDGSPEALGQEINVPPKVLAQALRGIVKNAIDASPIDAVVEVGVLDEKGWVTIQVRDQGTGIPAEILTRIGEPFFTTKEPGRGMGLGIFLARAVAERVGGALHLESEPNRGTIASMRVPAVVGK